jgi:beta-lactamase regulating signal transducer with metallopeptidase domain
MQTILEIGLSNAVVATFLAVVALAVTRLWRAPALAHVLWLMVLVKLVTPPLVSIPIPWSISQWAATPKPVDRHDDARNESAAPELSVLAAATEDDWWVSAIADVPADQSVRLVEPADNPLSETAFESWPSWNAAWNVPLIVSLWMGGTLVCAIVAAVRIHRFHRVLLYAGPASPIVQLEAIQIADRLGLDDCPSVWLAPGRFSPLLWAVGGRARVILPAGLFYRLGPDEQRTVLAHELAHARRHDHWVRWLELIVICLYWWHPAAWFARRKLQQAEEQCCDAWVVWAIPAAAKAYAKALLNTVEFLDASPSIPPVASGIGHVPLLKRRLNMIVRNPLCPRLAWPAYLGVVLLGLAVLPLGTGCLFAQAPSEDEVVVTSDDEDDEQPSSDKQREEMERRLDRLERRLDKVIRALEARGTASEESEKPSKAKEEKREKKEVKKVIRLRDETAKEAKKDREADGREDEKRRVKVRVENLDPEKVKEIERRIEEAVNKATNPERMKALKKRLEEEVNRAVDPERMKELRERIDVILKKNLDPERIKALQSEIERSVRRSFDPERMKQLQKQIEESVKKSVDPERMMQLRKEIEESVHRSVEEMAKHAEAFKQAERQQERAERAMKEAEEARRGAQERASQERERAMKQAEEARRAAQERARELRAEAREKERAKRAEQTESKSARRSDDLERRVQRLEERMDRILQKLESSKEK